MPMFQVVPANKGKYPRSRSVNVDEPFLRVMRPIFAGPKDRFRIGIVVAYPRSASRSLNAELIERLQHGRTLHGAAVVGMQYQRFPETFERNSFCQIRLLYQSTRMFGALFVPYLPTDDFSAVEVEDQIQIEIHAPNGSRQPGNIPHPHLIGSRCTVAGRLTRFPRILSFSPVMLLVIFM